MLPACWILKNIGFHVGLSSFFITSVLQSGIFVLFSTTFEITKKGSYNTQIINTNAIQLAHQKGKNKHREINKNPVGPTLLEKRSLYSKSEQLNIISIVVFELTDSSACTRIFPRFWGWFALVESSLCKRSMVNGLSRVVIICMDRKYVYGENGLEICGVLCILDASSFRWS